MFQHETYHSETLVVHAENTHILCNEPWLSGEIPVGCPHITCRENNRGPSREEYDLGKITDEF